MSDGRSRAVPRFDLHTLVHGFAKIGALYILGMPLTLLANIALARTLSVTDFGTFGFTISLASTLAVPLVGGLPMLLTREISGYVYHDNWNSYRGIISSAYGWVGSFAALIVIGVSGLLLWNYSNAPTGGTLLIAALLVPFLGLAAVRSGILKGLGRPGLAEAPTQVVQPLLLIVGYFALAQLGLSTANAMLWWYLTVSVIIFVIAALTLMWVQPAQVASATASLEDLPQWLRSLVPFAMLGAVTTVGAQVGILLLGFYGADEDVALLKVAERGAQLVSFPLAFINAILGPYFVNARNSDDPKALKRISRFSTWLMFVPSLPIAIILVVFGRPLIAMTFGSPYDVLAYQPMVILVVAHLTSVTLGNSGMMLAMSGYERSTLWSMVLSLVLTVVIAIALIAPLGATGAAIAIAVGAVAAKLFAFFAVKRKLGIWSGLF